MSTSAPPTPTPPELSQGADRLRDADYDGDYDDGDHAETPFWTDEPGVLLYRWYEVVPYGWFSPARRGNALTRLAFLVGAVLILNRLRGNASNGILFVLATLVTSVLAIVFISRRVYAPSHEPFTDADLAAGRPGGGGSGADDDDFSEDVFEMDDHQFNNATAEVSHDTADADLAFLAGGTIDRRHQFEDVDITTSVVQPHAA